MRMWEEEGEEGKEQEAQAQRAAAAIRSPEEENKWVRRRMVVAPAPHTAHGPAMSLRLRIRIDGSMIKIERAAGGESRGPFSRFSRMSGDRKRTQAKPCGRLVAGLFGPNKHLHAHAPSLV